MATFDPFGEDIRRLMRQIAAPNGAIRQLTKTTNLVPPLASESIARALRQMTAGGGRQLTAGLDPATRDVLLGRVSPRIDHDQVQRMISSVGIDHDKLKATTAAMRIPDDQWLGIIEASRISPRNLNAAITAAGISGKQWQDIINASSASALVQSPSIPRDQLRTILDGIAGVARDYAAGDVAEAADALAAEVETAEPIAEAEGTNLSWLVNLPLAGQLTTLFAALQVLDAVGQWAMVTFTDDELPPEVTTAVHAVFMIVGLLLTLAELRSRPPDDK